MSCPAVLSQLRGSLDGQKASHTKAQFVIETQQWYNFVISNVTFKAVKSTDDETTNTKARRWSIRGLKGLTFPLAATIIEGEKRTKKKSCICRLLEIEAMALQTSITGEGHASWKAGITFLNHII